MLFQGVLLMLPSFIRDTIHEVVKPLNPIIANGIATLHLDSSVQFIESVAECVFKTGLPPELKYLGPGVRCTPEEELAITTKGKGKSSTKKFYDVAESNVYLMKYSFQYLDEEPIHVYTHLAYSPGNNMLTLNGSRFMITPVLADLALSVQDHKTIFVRVLKARIKAHRTPSRYIVDGVLENMYVTHSNLYNKKTPMKPSTKAKHTLMHYCLSKYGFSETFKRFSGVVPDVIELSKYKTIQELHEDYPPKDWVFCKSANSASRPGAMMQKLNFKLAIPRAKFDKNLYLMAGAFFYICDHFPSHVNFKDVSFAEPIEGFHLDNPSIWRILLGYCIFNDSIYIGKLLNDVTDHINSIDRYIDPIYGSKLKRLGYPCETTYELFHTIMLRFDEWILESDDRVCTMYGKEISVLPYVYDEIISGFNSVIFGLNKLKGKGFNSKRFAELLRAQIRPWIAFKMKNHQEVTSISFSGDNIALAVTNSLMAQGDMAVRGGKTRKSNTDPSLKMHVSIGEVGDVYGVLKSEPSGRRRINPLLQLEGGQTVIRDESIRAQLDMIQVEINK